MVKIHYENGGSVKVTFRKIRNIFGQHNRPSETAIKNLVVYHEYEIGVNRLGRKWHIFYVLDMDQRVFDRVVQLKRSKPGANSVEKDPNLSIPRLSQQLELPKPPHGEFCLRI